MKSECTNTTAPRPEGWGSRRYPLACSDMGAESPQTSGCRLSLSTARVAALQLRQQAAEAVHE